MIDTSHTPQWVALLKKLPNEEAEKMFNELLRIAHESGKSESRIEHIIKKGAVVDGVVIT